MKEMTHEEKYILARWCYSIGEEIIDDAEYNTLHQLMKTTNTLPEYVNRSWSSDPCPYELLKKFGMESKAYSIVLSDKTESIESITTEDALADKYKYIVEAHYLSYKHDGWNVQLIYHNTQLILSSTRGRRSDALDIGSISHIFPNNIPREGKVKIVGELTLTNSNFKALKELFPDKNLQSQRSAVRTAIANKEAHHLLTFTAFDIIEEDKDDLMAGYIFFLLSKWGFDTPTYRVATNYEELVRAIKDLSDARSIYPHPTDGIVVRTMQGKELRAVRVFNWEEPVYKSFVIGYLETTAAHSRPISLQIHPIKLGNSTQRQIPITNIGRIVKNRLEIGSPVAFRIKSESIADIDEAATAMLQHMYKDNYNEFKHLIEYTEQMKYLSE